MIYMSRDNFVVTISIDREEKLNAITPEMANVLAGYVQEINQSGARVVVLRGTPKVFCAGSDIKSLDHYPQPWDYRIRTDDYTRSIRNLRMPVIAMVQGYCLGGGMEMALQADIRYADRTAKFGTPEVQWGWIGGGGASQLLPRLIGSGRALEMLLTGRQLDAERAYEIGLIDRLVDADNLERETYSLAADIASKAPIATQVIKKAVRMSQNIGIENGLDYENELVHITFSTEDKQEGVQAFKDKRRPMFKGR